MLDQAIGVIRGSVHEKENESKLDKLLADADQLSDRVRVKPAI